MTKYTSVSGIYIILNTRNGNFYIGQALDIKRRWADHKHRLNNGKHNNKHLQRAWLKYGANTFQFKKLEYCAIEQLDEREQHYLNLYVGKDNCYNVSVDAKGGRRGRKHTPEARLKMSKALKGRVKSPEECRKISEALKGRKASEESRRNQSNAQIGRKHSEETKHKIGEGNRGKKLSEKEIQRLSQLHKGKKLSDEQKRQLSERGKGRVVSEETRQKLRIANTNPSAETRRKRSEAQMGEKNHRFGKKNSPETRQKIRDGHARRRLLKRLAEAEQSQ